MPDGLADRLAGWLADELMDPSPPHTQQNKTKQHITHILQKGVLRAALQYYRTNVPGMLRLMLKHKLSGLFGGAFSCAYVYNTRWSTNA